MSSARRSLTELGNGAMCVWVRPSLRAPGDRAAIDRAPRSSRSFPIPSVTRWISALRFAPASWHHRQVGVGVREIEVFRRCSV